LLARKINLPSDQRSLIRLYTRLNEEQRATLLAFAEFLASGKGVGADVDEKPVWPEPKLLPRPEQESVIGAIKRLSESYFMLDRSELLTETSSLMSAHIMKGREASAVIDDLEALFAANYAQQAHSNQ